MGCTSSKENTHPPTTTTITDNSQQLINDHFRKWLKSNRPKADEYVLNDIISTTQQPTNIDDYRPIVRKALDLLLERHDIKTTNKLTKLVQKEVSFASPKKVARTIDVLKQTAEKLRHGQVFLNGDQQSSSSTTNGENNTKTAEKKQGQVSSGEPGIALKEALEKARISFYRGKQAAIFANPNGGYDVRIIDENDDTLNHDGNLLRSIIVTEVKMRPKSTVSTTLPQFHAPPPPPPPPPPPKLLDEHEIGDDFRRSIDAALKGLEAIYQTPFEPTHETHLDKVSSSEDQTVHLADIIRQEKAITNTNGQKQQPISQNDIQPKLVGAVDDMDEIMINTIEVITGSQIGDPVPPIHYNAVEKLVMVEPNETTINGIKEQEGNVVTRPTSSDSARLTSTLQNENLTKEQTNSSIISDRVVGESIRNHETSINHINEEHNSIPTASSSPPIDMNTTVKSPSHNVTYTEIIHSESRDGEQSRRFITESYDDQSPTTDDQTTSRKITTKSEFSNHPSSGEKTMEQSVQVITVKVRNETITTTNPSQTSDSDLNTVATTI